jgi:hypothetical protein
MSGFDGEGLLCSYDELRDYLRTNDVVHDLLSYVRERNGRYDLVEEKYAGVTDGTLKYQLA